MRPNDPIADLLTKIRNAQKAGHESVVIPASKIKIGVVHILKQEGFVSNYRCIRDKKQGVIRVSLKYRGDGQPVISDLKRMSTPSRRLYCAADKLQFVKSGFGIGIYSTSKGIMSDRDARKNRLGGEYICKVF